MKSIVELLSEKDLENLALFYERPEFKSFRKLVDLERDQLGKDALAAWQADPKQVAYLAGGAYKLKGLVKAIKDINRMMNKKED